MLWSGLNPRSPLNTALSRPLRRLATVIAAVSLSACAPEAVPSASRPDAPPAGWQAGAQAAIASSEYAPHLDGEAFRSTNRAQDFRAVFDERGLAIHPRTGAGEVRLSLVAWVGTAPSPKSIPRSPKKAPASSG